MPELERIAKFIAGAGVCSRREAERLIGKGAVKVDGKIITSPALKVGDDNIIEVNDSVIKSIKHQRLWLYYKPPGYITTHNDPQNRPTVFSLLRELPRVISIGRLDINSEGLLLLTNSGNFVQTMESPSNKFERVYKVRAHGHHNNLEIHDKEIIIDGIIYRPKLIILIKKGKANSWYKVVLTEGKNREIRRIFEYFNLTVSRLIRVSYGKYELGDLKPGQYREVKI